MCKTKLDGMSPFRNQIKKTFHFTLMIAMIFKCQFINTHSQNFAILCQHMLHVCYCFTHVHLKRHPVHLTHSTGSTRYNDTDQSQRINPNNQKLFLSAYGNQSEQVQRNKNIEGLATTKKVIQSKVHCTFLYSLYMDCFKFTIIRVIMLCVLFFLQLFEKMNGNLKAK